MAVGGTKLKRYRVQSRFLACGRRKGRRSAVVVPVASGSTPRLIQGKREARLFYAFLSKVYDTIVNPFHWTEDMRSAALEPLDLAAGQRVYDVGGGTGFTTLGVLERGVHPEDVTLVDQSEGQMEKARAKSALRKVTVEYGDAENLKNLATDSADRYVSAGSIEYWPSPQRGICEAYRVIKPGGKACIIGPVHPTNSLSAFFADLWMLFPTEQEYKDWFDAAGFEDVTLERIGPKWYEGDRTHGLIMGCSVVGVKKAAGESPGAEAAVAATTSDDSDASEAEDSANTTVGVVMRSLLGSVGGFYYFLLPIFFYIRWLLKGLAKRVTTPSSPSS